jgi:folate-binding protein YgfZ
VAEVARPSEAGDPAAGLVWDALRHGVVAFELDRDVLAVDGPDASGYLHGQLSQDIAGLADGSSAWSWVLAPTGKVDALVRVSRRSPEHYVIEVDKGWGGALGERLGRFKLRTKVEIGPLAWRGLGLRGPRARPPLAARGGTAVVIPGPPWPGQLGFDLLGPEPMIGDLDEPGGGDPRAEPVRASAGAYEVLRVEVGIPRMGAELTDRTIPAETGLVDHTVSFTKGCYTGQELVERIDSRGSNVARRLRGLRLGGAVEVGAELEGDGRLVGTVTSVARSPDFGWIALAWVARAVEPSAELRVGAVTALVEALPRSP